MKIEAILAFVSFLASISGIIFAYLAFKRSREQDDRITGKNEGVMFSDIGYIKACVDRVEKNLNKVDERDRNIAERLAKLEETVFNVTKRVDKLYKDYFP